MCFCVPRPVLVSWWCVAWEECGGRRARARRVRAQRVHRDRARAQSVSVECVCGVLRLLRRPLPSPRAAHGAARGWRTHASSLPRDGRSELSHCAYISRYVARRRVARMHRNCCTPFSTSAASQLATRKRTQKPSELNPLYGVRRQYNAPTHRRAPKRSATFGLRAVHSPRRRRPRH